MTTAASQSDELRFVPLKHAGLSSWHRLVSFPWLDRLGVLPVADTEFLALSHFCPIAIEMHESGPRAVAILHAQLVAHRLLTEDGRWRPPYAPLALRSLPFRNGAAMTADAVEICPALAEQGADPKLRQAIFGHKGGPTQSYAAILSMIDRLARSGARLRNAAKVLMAADLLVPLANLPPGPFGQLHTISLDGMLALSSHRLMALTSDACCPLELATAVTFSRRWLNRDTLKSADNLFAATVGGVRQKLYEHGVVDPLDQPVGLDDSPLFSFDDYVRSTPGSS
ncbi:SapC family protein [Phreatobacter stygius]|nr:SapC family protein [Phreatobacter stygius]